MVLLSLGLAGCAAMSGSREPVENIEAPAASGEPERPGISEVPNPSREMAAKSGLPLARLQRGHEVYMLKCGECHEYMLPEKVDIEDWEDSLPKMIGHAGLEKSDEQAVLDYVRAVKVVKGVD
jgi:cytochrome c5